MYIECTRLEKGGAVPKSSSMTLGTAPPFIKGARIAIVQLYLFCYRISFTAFENHFVMICGLVMALPTTTQ